MQSLQTTAHDIGDSYPIAKSHVMSSSYVDDCLAGVDYPLNSTRSYANCYLKEALISESGEAVLRMSLML